MLIREPPLQQSALFNQILDRIELPTIDPAGQQLKKGIATDGD
jgi:hypothetical protein